jgi:hypothetical protein
LVEGEMMREGRRGGGRRNSRGKVSRREEGANFLLFQEQYKAEIGLEISEGIPTDFSDHFIQVSQIFPTNQDDLFHCNIFFI